MRRPAVHETTACKQQEESMLTQKFWFAIGLLWIPHRFKGSWRDDHASAQLTLDDKLSHHPRGAEWCKSEGQRAGIQYILSASWLYPVSLSIWSPAALYHSFWRSLLGHLTMTNLSCSCLQWASSVPTCRTTWSNTHTHTSGETINLDELAIFGHWHVDAFV